MIATLLTWIAIAVEAFCGIMAGLLLKKVTGEHLETATWIPTNNLLSERVVESDIQDGFDTIAQVSSDDNSEDLHVFETSPTPII